jgi:hypothetical protein
MKEHAFYISSTDLGCMIEQSLKAQWEYLTLPFGRKVFPLSIHCQRVDARATMIWDTACYEAFNLLGQRVCQQQYN